jgi:hypothetical protein
MTVVDAIKLMLEPLSREEQNRVLDEIIRAFRPITVPGAGEVLRTIVRLLPNHPAWTTREIKQELAASGSKATDKEISNSLAYLTRKRHIQRVGYGRYLIPGIGKSAARGGPEK